MTPWPSLTAALAALGLVGAHAQHTQLEPPWRCGEALRTAREKLETAFAGPTVTRSGKRWGKL